jgi:hypothetical protein
MQALEVRAKSRQCLCPEANAAVSIRAGRFMLQFEFAEFLQTNVRSKRSVRQCKLTSFVIGVAGT